MPIRDLYQQLYKSLNKAQKQAVNAIEGPVMVIAGPGTGKTQILTLRIANILRETDTDPRSILALTFTESGVVSMRKRLSEIIGDTAYSVNINTFHGFCNDVIKNHPEEFPRIIGSRNISEIEQIQIIEKLINKLPLKELRPFGDKYYYVRAILTNINQMKREGVNEKDCAEITAKKEKIFPKIEGLRHAKGPHAGEIKGEYKELWKQIVKNKELAKIYSAYQKELSGKKLYDYSDMIMEVFSVLRKNSDILLILQEHYQYFLVDEHQDTNNAQNKILELLAGFYPNPNIFIVGDEKQAIFRFQGASLENFAYFKKLYPSAKIITLEENYRSTQQILDSAHELAMAMPHSGIKLKSQSEKGEKIKICKFAKSDSELFWIADSIKEKMKNTAPREIAVLYRDNKDAFPIARALEKSEVPYSIESDQDIFDDVEIKKLMILLKAVSDFGSEEAFIEAMHLDFLGIHPLDIYKIASAAGDRRSKLSLFEIVSSDENLKRLNISDREKILSVYKKISEWARTGKNETLLSTFEKIAKESGYLSHILSLKNAYEAIEKTGVIFNEAKSVIETKRGAMLKDFLAYIETLKEHNLYLKRSVTGTLENRVRLMTAHKSKGQEFEYVYIINAYDGHWGNRKKSNVLPLFPEIFSLFGTSGRMNDEMDDERRLFYVALTRAKKEAIITHAEESEGGKERLASIFVQEIRPELVENISAPDFEKEIASNPILRFSTPEEKYAAEKEKELVKELFIKNGFSVTHLNNYLECPWKYFYVNLLRIPQAQTKYQMYGTAVHQALKDFFDAVRSGKKTDKKLLIEKFSIYIEKQAFSENDLCEVKEKGKTSLGGYYDLYAGSWNPSSLNELNISGVKISNGISLTGKIDKLEFTGNGNNVVVTDYKTSKPKSRGEIEGKTRNSDGNIKRQLVFYKLLLDKFERGRYKMKSGIIDFIEPDERGRYRLEKFDITSEETCELETLLKNVSDEILKTAFWNKTCSDKNCEFCGLRKLIKSS